jgi:hypothetical protein
LIGQHGPAAVIAELGVPTPDALRASPDPIVQQFITGQSSGPTGTPGS